MASTSTPFPEKTHLDIHDHTARQNMANALGVTETQLKKAAQLVGTRISTIRGHLGK